MATLSYPSQTSLGKRKAVDISRYSSVARFCVVRPSKTSYDEDYHSDSTQDESDFEIDDESDGGRSDTPGSSPGSSSSNLSAGVKHLRTGPRADKRTVPRPKVYVCTHSNCGKAYSRPSRLEEHKRSHTGVVRIFLKLQISIANMSSHSARSLAPSVQNLISASLI